MIKLLPGIGGSHHLPKFVRTSSSSTWHCANASRSTQQMVIKEINNGSLIGYSVDKADEFLALALLGDKKQKQILKRLYDDREEVVANFPSELVLKALGTPSFLECADGRRLAAHFLLDNLECMEFLTFIKEQVKSYDPNRSLCEHWGESVIYAWKIAPEPNGHSTVVLNDDITKKKLETEIIQDLFYYSLIYPKKYAQKFAWIVDGFLPECIKKKFSTMFFRCLLPILWRNLESVNQDVRLNASRLLLKLYPLQADDDVLNAEYIQKQNVAMDSMLMDPCVAIRVEAIKKILLHLRLHWNSFPRYIIKVYLGKIVDELSLDSVDEVRVAVYEGMTHLLYCSPAITATEHALEILGKRGINDKAEKVRLAAFKLLNNLVGHRTLKCFNVVDMDNILLRLDFEHSNSVQSQIVKLIFKSFCPKNVEGLDYVERFKRIRYMCNVSRNASLNFHRHIYPLKLINMEHGVLHIRSLLIAVKQIIKKQRQNSESNNSQAELEISELNLTDASHMLMEANGDDGEAAIDTTLSGDEQLKMAKDVLDSAIVLWMSLRFDLYTKYAKENSEIIKIMANVSQSLDPYWNTPLLDSALVIASNLPKEKVGRTFQKVLNNISTTEFNEVYFNHYIEALSNWDMDKLINIINEELEVLYKRVACDDNGAQVRMTHDHLNVSVASERDSPPIKRVKKTSKRGQTKSKQNAKTIQTEMLDRPLVFLKVLLASPSSCENLRSHYAFHLQQFRNILLRIRAAFGVRLRLNNFQNIDIDLMVNAYETLTLLSLITKNEVQERGSEEEEEDNDRTLIDERIHDSLQNDYSMPDRICLNEIRWYEKIASDVPVPYKILKMFMRCINLHLDCSQLSPEVLSRLFENVQEIYNITDMDIVGHEVKQCAKHLSRALEFCGDQCTASLQKRMQDIQGKKE